MKTRASIFAGILLVALIGISLKNSVSEDTPSPAPKAATEKKELPKTPVVFPEDREVATLAAGCFWSMEAIYKQIKGVEKAEPGYAGGHVAKPTYEQVGQADTGHAEAVQITFDPKVISYGELVRVLVTTRNPTTLNEQKPDSGPQYRSEIFAHNETQAKIARETIAQVAASKIWKDPIVTPVTEFSKYVMAPEIAHFRAQFKELLKP